MKKLWMASLVLVSVCLAAAGSAAASGQFLTQEASRFLDTDSHWAKNAIDQAVKSGVVRGFPDGTFKPDSDVTRAEFLAIATRASALPNVGAVEPFDDVTADHWAFDAINQAIGMGFIDLADYGGSFAPDKALTRAEMVKWLVNGLVKGDKSFADALKDTEETILPFTEYFPGKFDKKDIPFIAVARGVGLVSGFPDGSFGPERTTTRAEVVVLIERYLRVEGTVAEQYKALNELREVGTTGTNMVSLMNAKWAHTAERELPFPEAFNTPLVTRGNLGEYILNRYIVIDKQMTSVYADMFITKTQQESIKRDTTRFRPIVLLEVTLTPNRDLTYNEFSNGGGDLGGSSLSTEKAEQYGLTAIKGTNSTLKLKKEKTVRFWSRTSITAGIPVAVTTESGRSWGFIIPREE